MKHETQLAWVRKQLIRHGRVSRNQALRRYISRLAARIADLRAEGLQIIAETRRTRSGNDYVYKLVK